MQKTSTATPNQITIVLDMPPSSNTAYPTNRRGGRHLSKAGGQWKRTAILLVRAAFQEKPPERFGISIALWFPTRRKADVDNYIKLAKDAICEAFDTDDDWTVVPWVEVRACGVDKQRPRCEVVISEVSE